MNRSATVDSGTVITGALVSACEDGNLGLFPASDFTLPGVGDSVPDAARWYFEREVVAVPAPGVPVTSSDSRRSAVRDVAEWFNGADAAALQARPRLLWLAGHLVARDVRLGHRATGTARHDPAGHDPVSFRLTDRIATNRSYFDATSQRFFDTRTVRARGDLVSGPEGTAAFVARTLWPEDYVLGLSAPRLAVADDNSLKALVESCPTGPSASYSTHLLWEREPGAAAGSAGRPALGIVLNGAQSDDDEALGGHFAIATGDVGPRGEWSHWITNNFYSLEWFSEKGIIASMLPMDNYLMDLNSGQSYYRPSYVLAVVLKTGRAALAYQAAVARAFDHFYRQDLRYSHSQANCAGISLDVLRALGWRVPYRGPTSRLEALGAFVLVGIQQRSLALGRSAYHYFMAERTRLLPAMAFYAAGTDLLRLCGALDGLARPLTRYERWLREDVEAVAFVHVPQVPSSRSFGTFPVASLQEYRARTPRDRSKWKTIPLEKRPFPADLATRRAAP